MTFRSSHDSIIKENVKMQIADFKQCGVEIK